MILNLHKRVSLMISNGRLPTFLRTGKKIIKSVEIISVSSTHKYVLQWDLSPYPYGVRIFLVKTTLPIISQPLAMDMDNKVSHLDLALL